MRAASYFQGSDNNGFRSICKGGGELEFEGEGKVKGKGKNSVFIFRTIDAISKALAKPTLCR